MRRVVLRGEDLAAMPAVPETRHIKLLFSPDGRGAFTPAQEGEAKPVMRTYTVRAFDPARRAMTVDFAVHGGGHGPASRWAASAKAGDTMLMSGPGSTKLVDNAAPWFLLAADLTGLPALACNLEQLPADARGVAFVEIVDEADRQEIAAPAGVELRWLVNPAPGETDALLVDAIGGFDWLPGEPYVWVACEFGSMKRIRALLRERSHDRRLRYISSYWKHNCTEEQHKVVKNEDQTAVG